MNNNMENNTPTSPITKSSKGVVVTILIIIVLALSGYLLYDKVLSKKDTNETKESSEPSEDDVLTDEEALKIGNELFGYVTNYGDYYNENKYVYDDTEELEIDGDIAYELSNYDEIMSHYAKDCKMVRWSESDVPDGEEEVACESDVIITKDTKHYYLELMQGDNIYFAFFGKLTVANKTSDKIEFAIDYAYCADGTYADSDEEEYPNKCLVYDDEGEEVTKTLDPYKVSKPFVIVKEGNDWKVQKYYIYN